MDLDSDRTKEIDVVKKSKFANRIRREAVDNE
jgi:hypothetical protein